MICTLGIATPGMYNVDAATHHNNDPCFWEKMKPLKELCKPIPPPKGPVFLEKLYCHLNYEPYPCE